MGCVQNDRLFALESRMEGRRVPPAYSADGNHYEDVSVSATATSKI